MKRFIPIATLAATAISCSAYEKTDSPMTEEANVRETSIDYSESGEEAEGEEAEAAPSADPAPDAVAAIEEPPMERLEEKKTEKSRKPSTTKTGALATDSDQDGTEEYQNYGVNPLTKTVEDRFSTFSIDVDTGSYTIARKKLMAGVNVPASSVRVEEFVNYFRYDYPSPDNGAFGIHFEAAPSPFTTKKDKYIMRVGVQGKRLTRAERKPVHLTFLVDVSGSMGRKDKLPLAIDALTILTNNLQEDDTVAIATYAGRVAEILKPTADREKITKALKNLQSGGGTGMSDGMELAYKLALKAHKPGHVNRVIVLSDGDANIGASSHRDILAKIKSYVDEGVTLSTIGFGMGNYKDTMMEQLANKGNGNYYYIDSRKEAQKVFGEQLDGTLQVIAKDVKIQVEFDPKKISEYRLVGYENRDIADEDFRDDSVDAGEIGAGHSVTALYEVKLKPNASGTLATVRVRAKKPNGHEAQELAFDFLKGDVRSKLSQTSRDFQFQMAVAQFAEILRKSPYAKGLTLDLVHEVAKGATAKEADRKELLKLIRKAKRLR